MASLESLTAGALVRGVIADGDVEVITAKWFGDSAVELTYKVPDTGLAGIRLLYRDDEVGLHIVEQGLPWSFDGDGDLFRLISEAQRIGLVHLFDPVLAVHTSIVDPLPHQITAVYEAMLPRQGSSNTGRESIGVRPRGPRIRQARLRHREPSSRDWQASLYRGQGEDARSRNCHGHEERDSHLVEQA